MTDKTIKIEFIGLHTVKHGYSNLGYSEESDTVHLSFSSEHVILYLITMDRVNYGYNEKNSGTPGIQ